MHLLLLGVTKLLLEKLFVKGPYLIKKPLRKKFSKLLKNLEKNIPAEFARKQLDIDDIQFWKATQFRLFLLYCSPFVLKKYLSATYYKHFMLFFEVARIVCSNDHAVKFADFAKNLAEHFFKLCPSLYGKDSQVINIHNFGHIVDDVIGLEAPPSLYSAFPFENFLGFLKSLIHSPVKPLEQILNRIEEIEKTEGVQLKQVKTIEEWLF